MKSRTQALNYIQGTPAYSNEDAVVCPLDTEKQHSRFSMLVFGLDLCSRNLCEQIYRSLCY